MKDQIEREDAIDAVHKSIFEFFDICNDDEESPMTDKDEQLLEINKAVTTRIKALQPAQPEEVIPHRNYKYLSDYWCKCGWHLGKKGGVKYCAECGRKVKWNG